MTLPNLPEVPPNPTTQQLAQVVGALVQELSYLLGGFLSSSNAREFGGWQIGQTELQSKDKTVGMSTEQTVADDIRFWAGDVKTGSPKFVVKESGEASLTEAVISSAATGDKVVIDSTGLHTYYSGVERMTIGTATAKGVKAITGRDAAGVPQSVITYDTEFLGTGQYITAHGSSILLDNNGDIFIQDGGGRGIRIVSGYPEMSNGFGWSTIARSGASTSAGGSHSHGIPNGTQLLDADGVTVWTFNSDGGHSHTQT